MNDGGFWIFMGFMYFMPVLVAAVRKTINGGAVFVVNLFLGWTVLGWIIALAMAAGGRKYPANGY